MRTLHGTGVLEWKVNGTKAADLTALKAAIQEAEGKNESDYTASSWKTFAKALEKQRNVAAADNTVTQEAGDLARTNLLKAANALVKKVKNRNMIISHWKRKADGICDYTNDLGGLATLNDGYEPTESHDHIVAWHNWNNRYENGVAKNAW